MELVNIETAGQSIQSVVVEGVEATNVLQAEFIAESAVNHYAKTNGLVNSTMNWDSSSQSGGTYTIKFF